MSATKNKYIESKESVLESKFWGKYIIAYRRLHRLSQEQLAVILSVSAPTVSRWESGRQVPDSISQTELRKRIPLLNMSSASDWVYRVSHAHDYELLTDANSNILAFSAGAVQYWRLDPEPLIGLNVLKAMPGGLEAVRAQFAKLGYSGDLTKHLVEGNIRQVCLTIDFNFSGKRGSVLSDVWVMVTPDPKTLVHYVWRDTDLPPDIESVEGLRIRNCEVTMFS